MNFTESIKLAINSVVSNKLRSGLTLLSVTIGVLAIVGAGTLTDSMDQAVHEEMASIGETTFTISQMPTTMNFHDRRKYMHRKDITYKQFNQFKETVSLDNIEFVSTSASTSGSIVSYNGLSTDPDVTISGGDENYLSTAARDLESGRPINATDISFRRNVALIGNDVIVKIFPKTSPIGKTITAGNHKFEVIGILDTKGASFGQSRDNLIVVPIENYLQYYSSEWDASMTINVRAKSTQKLNDAIDDAIASFRVIRNLKPWTENDFEVNTNESISQNFDGFTTFLTYFGLICGVVSLGAAGVGIMNIMLVSVKERTREIGIRKALGAKSSQILWQFIIETITICQIGCMMGIVLGCGCGWILSLMMDMSVVIPYKHLIISIVICTILGLLSGAYPAWRAAKQDPIEALRYE